MDRLRALEILDAARPDSIDLNDAEFAEAIAFLEQDDRSAHDFALRQKFDAQLGRAMRQVTVPVNLKDQLLASLRDASSQAAEQQELSTPDVMPLPGSSPSNRTIFKVAAVCIAASLLMSVSFWLYNASSQNVYGIGKLHQVAATHLNNWQNLPAFSGHFTPALPGYGWQNRIQSSEIIKGIAVDSEADHTVALYQFRVATGSRSSVTGLLLVIEKSSVSNPPLSTDFSSANVSYIPTEQGESAAVTWSDDTQVYICIVQDARSLNKIEQALRSTPA